MIVSSLYKALLKGKLFVNTIQIIYSDLDRSLANHAGATGNVKIVASNGRRCTCAATDWHDGAHSRPYSRPRYQSASI